MQQVLNIDRTRPFISPSSYLGAMTYHKTGLSDDLRLEDLIDRASMHGQASSSLNHVVKLEPVSSPEKSDSDVKNSPQSSTKYGNFYESYITQTTYNANLVGRNLFPPSHIHGLMAASQDEGQAGESSEENKLFKCRRCEKAFAHPGSLKLHERVHTGIKPFSCCHCGKSFTQSGSLKTHIRLHTGEKPHQCTICDKAFTAYSTLVIHNRTHTNLKPYKCESCGKRFTQSSSLKTHQRLHTGEKPFHCHFCDKYFSANSTLSIHMKKTHNCPDKKRTFECEKCGMVFERLNGLERHFQKEHYSEDSDETDTSFGGHR